jgi:DNA polymerase-3 subunit epsilon
MSWMDARWCAFDVESTGVDVTTCRFVSAAVIHVGAVEPKDPKTWIVNPGVPIPAGATEVHKITDEMVTKSGTPASTAIDEIAGSLAAALDRAEVLVAFNGAFDLSMLHCECRRYGLPTVAERLGRPIAPVLDPHVIDKAVDKYRKGKRTLTAVCEHYEVPLGADAHASDADALATARLMYKLGARYPQLTRMGVDELHAAQVGWRSEQNASLQGHFDRKRQDGEPREVVETGWPLLDKAMAVAS